MASADAVVAQGLECCLCFEYFNEPKNLTCGHTFCKECLDHLYKSHTDQNQLSCPTCRQITIVINGDIAKLQTNLSIKSMVHDVRATERLCTACDPEAKSPAVLYCAQCHTYLCDPCAVLHGKFKITKKHDVVSMEDVNRGKVKVRRFCTKHPEEEKLYVCTSCNMAICYRCRMIDHAKLDHEIKEVPHYKVTILRQIESLQNKATSKIAMIEAQAEQVKFQKAVVQLELDQRIAEINQAYEEVIKHLMKERNDLIDICKQKRATYIATLQAIKESKDKLKSCIQSASELVGNGIKASLEGQTLAMHNKICCDLEKLLDDSDPNAIQTKSIVDQAKGVTFIKSSTPQRLGELRLSDWQLDHVSTFPLSNSLPMNAVHLPDGRVAVSYTLGMAIEMFTVDGPQETVLRDVYVVRVSVLSDGRYVVQDSDNNITLYTQAWEQLKVRFNKALRNGYYEGMCVDRDDNIYVGNYDLRKHTIVIFRPEGGAPFREIQCLTHTYSWKICHMNHSRRLVGCLSRNLIGVIDDMDEKGAILHQTQVDGESTPIAVLKDDSILIACWKGGLLSIELYTKDLMKIRAVLMDFPLTQCIATLTELPTGEIVVVSEKQFIVFRKF